MTRVVILPRPATGLQQRQRLLRPMVSLYAVIFPYVSPLLTHIRDEHSEVRGSGGNWLGMEAPDPRGSVCEQAQPQ